MISDYLATVTRTYLDLLNNTKEGPAAAIQEHQAVKGYSKIIDEPIAEIMEHIENGNPEQLGAAYVTTHGLTIYQAWALMFKALNRASSHALARIHLAAVRKFLEEAIIELEDLIPEQADWELTPNTIYNVHKDEVITSGHPLQDTIGADKWSSSSRNRPMMMTPGDTILMHPGEYPHFRVTHTYDEDGINEQTVIKAANPGDVLIKKNPVSGSSAFYIEWGGGYTFENLHFEGDDSFCIGTERPASKRWEGTHPGFRDIHFKNCSILGGWDAHTDEGPNNKWGVLSYELGRSAYDDDYGFSWEGGEISGIKKEHAFYMHNVIGDILIRDLKVKHCGRTFFQLTNRESEGPKGSGDIYLQNVDVEDVCLQQSGGGFAFTFKGNHDGTVYVTDSTCKLGCNEDLHPTYQPNITGCLSTHLSYSDQDPLDEIIIDRCHFEVGKYYVGEGPARRENVGLSHVRNATIKNTTIISHPGAREALRINLDTIDLLALGGNKVTGTCYVNDTKYQTYEDMLEALKDNPKVTILD